MVMNYALSKDEIAIISAAIDHYGSWLSEQRKMARIPEHDYVDDLIGRLKFVQDKLLNKLGDTFCE